MTLNVSSMPTDWWAWDGDNLYPLGICEDIEEAYERDDKRDGPSSNWVFSRESLTDFRDKINKELS